MMLLRRPKYNQDVIKQNLFSVKPSALRLAGKDYATGPTGSNPPPVAYVSQLTSSLH